jgi:hypothetical protein
MADRTTLSALQAAFVSFDSHQSMNDNLAESRVLPPRLRRIAISIGCVVLGVVGGLLVYVLLSLRSHPPAMTEADLDGAIARWKTHGPSSYEMTVEVSGRQNGMLHVVVKDGRPESVERNGVATPERTWKYWTVEGMFGTIRTDLEGLDQPERAFGEKDLSQLVQEAEFDTELGYPRRYRRAVLSTGEFIEWEVTEFRS